MNDLSLDNFETRTPPCPHFDKCGGCELQHLSLDSYKTYKKNHVLNKLQKLIPDIKISEMFHVEHYTRWRANFKISKGKLGFYEKKSNNIVELNECIILKPEILELAKVLFKNSFIRNNGNELNITLVDNGFDVIISASKDVSLKDFEALQKLAENHNIARLSISLNNKLKELLILRSPYIKIDGLTIYTALGGFLQASKESTEKLVSFVKTYANGKVLDLFCGNGTYSIPLSKDHFVMAFDGNEDSIKALKNSSKFNGLNPQAQTRDLFKNSLTDIEIKKFDTVVINPPRNGATPQVEYLTKSKVKKIIFISCDIGSYSRDIKLLLDKGYKLKYLALIDQFLYSNHIEIFSVLEL